jgi:hypothetical protein
MRPAAAARRARRTFQETFRACQRAVGPLSAANQRRLGGAVTAGVRAGAGMAPGARLPRRDRPPLGASYVAIVALVKARLAAPELAGRR